MAIQTNIKNQIVRIGDTIKVHHKIKEDDKTRTQVYEGVVISIKGRELNKSFTVRKISSAAIGVERIWPVNSPNISKVQVVKKGKVRRSKLYYLREITGKLALKIKEVDKKTSTQKSAHKEVKSKSEKKKTGSQGRKSGS